MRLSAEHWRYFMGEPPPFHHLDLDATRRHWDQRAATYDAEKRRNDAYYRALKQCLSDMLPEAPRARVLEVGCGTGQILAALTPREGIGVDISPHMIDAARARFRDRPELRFEVMQASGIGSLPGGEFDAVISADMLEHVDHWPAAVTSMVRACRPGGSIVLATPNPAWALPLWLLEKMRLKMPEGPHRFVWASHIAKLLAELGCTHIVHRTHMILPVNLAGLGSVVNRSATRLPALNRLGVIQQITARRGASVH